MEEYEKKLFSVIRRHLVVKQNKKLRLYKKAENVIGIAFLRSELILSFLLSKIVKSFLHSNMQVVCRFLQHYVGTIFFHVFWLIQALKKIQNQNLHINSSCVLSTDI